jgi:hypothetical protein
MNDKPILTKKEKSALQEVNSSELQGIVGGNCVAGAHRWKSAYDLALPQASWLIAVPDGPPSVLK